MRVIEYKKIVETVKQLCLKAAFELPLDMLNAVSFAYKKEKSKIGKKILCYIAENAEIAKKDKIPICQDTGIAVFFVEIGNNVVIKGGNLEDAINYGTFLGYRQGFLRASIVDDPLYKRINTKTNTPAVIHYNFIKGDKLTITFAPKGGGSENITSLYMLKPSDGEAGVISSVVETIKEAGAKPCPPVIVGIGIGGTAETAVYLSKKALLRPITKKNKNKKYSELEKNILNRINKTGIGPQGFGGKITALSVHIETFPCHIATLPVAVSVSCHALRYAKAVL